MSSDEYFDNDEVLDSAVLAQLDAIEAAHSNLPSAPITGTGHLTSSLAPTCSGQTQPALPLQSTSLEPSRTSALPDEASKIVQVIDVDADVDDSYDDILDNIDAAELERLDRDVENAYKLRTDRSCVNSALGPGQTRQLTLFGDTLLTPSLGPQRASQQTSQIRAPRNPRNPFGQKLRKTKKWDHTAFAKSGSKSAKSNQKFNTADLDEDDDEYSAEEFEQFPAPDKRANYSLPSPPAQSKLALDMLAAQTWIFPINQPKRDYQFNIIRESLFENTLVSLPTGLGKTFIAGVVMLNYYRWFPEGKVVFVAPTKPLVAQQIEACHKTCGIPGGDAAELTGQNIRATRAKAWTEKRVFYMTPQTLNNDLRTGNCDPTNIVLLVVDEAHKATGGYAYAQVVRYLMATNGHFRVLALTATPGSKAEAVQTIVDSLHISHIEIRDENSIDLRAYMQPKEISTHTIKMNGDVGKIRDLLAKVMDQSAKRLVTSGLIPSYNPVTLHTYRCNALMRDYTQDGTSRKFPWLFSALKKLGSLARAMAYLLECSIAVCYRTLQELTSDEKASKGFRSDPLFQELIKELEHQHNGGFPLHPKMEKMRSLTIDYFIQANTDAEEAAAHPRHDPNDDMQTKNNDTKMMIFTNFRASVDEIVDVLKEHEPLIRPTPFIGQGVDRSGRKGIAQKDQLEVIQKFKDGVYNVLVSTSVGEEGLDIGEVDMIICYDAQKTPIRMLQRVGRTGRKRAGKVAVLLSENREEANWQKAKNDYEAVQTSIVRGESLELYGDVDRLLPEKIKPKCLEMRMVIEEYTRETKPPKSQILRKGNKRKRNDDVHRNIPEGASTGFISSSKLIPKGGSKKRKLAPKEYDLNDVEDDEDDRAIQAGLHGSLVGHQSTSRGKGNSKEKSKRKPGTSTKRRKKIALSVQDSQLTMSQVSRALKCDSDDIEIEKGIDLSSPERPLACLSHVSLDVMDTPAHASAFAKSDPSHSLVIDSDTDEDFSQLHESLPVAHTPPKTPKESQNFRRSPLSHVPVHNTVAAQEPVLNSPSDATIVSNDSPECSFAVRAPWGQRTRKRIDVFPSSPTGKSPIPARSSPAPPPRKVQQHSKCVGPTHNKIWFDIEAEVSGDDIPGGRSDSEGSPDTEGSESDRRFVQELPATQATQSYDQTAAYRDGLFTQAPAAGPRFATKPVRRGAFGVDKPCKAQVSSSPAREEVSDKYSMDSFLIADDDDVLNHAYSSSSGL